jgi:protein-arginine kinase
MEYSRNLLGIPLVTIMTKENRKYVETQIKTILSDTKLFSGKYLEFLSDEEEIKKVLLENYVDYSHIDEFLTKSELKKNWPDNRAIFYSDKKDIIILINLIDHLKIISINKDYQACYNNLLDSINAFEKSLSFEIHRNYGYLTTCPSNLGSSLKISAQFKIQRILEKNVAKELLEKYSFDRKQNEKELLIVSENHKMNNKEEDFILNFYEKVNSLCFYERNIDVLANRLELKEITNKSITDSYNNTFNTYKLTLTPEKLGFNSIFDFSVKLPNSHLGIVLQSKNYYSIYKNFFDTYFGSEFRHDTNKNQTFNTSFDNYILEIKDMTKLIRTNVKVLRNVDTLSFNTSSNISHNLEELLKILKSNFKGSFAKINETQIISEYSINRFFSQELLNSGFYNEDAMNHVGVFSVEEKPIFIVLNDLDHLQFEINITNNDDIIKNITDLYSLVKKLEQFGIKYSNSSNYGILSQCPLYTGTGFNIYSTLRVNTITSKIDKLEELAKNLIFTYKIHDDDKNMIDILVFNHIGITEKELFEKWNKIVNQIIENDS